MIPEQLGYKLAEVLEVQLLLIGRVTYESFAGAWPARTGEFADKRNAMPKHVVSTTLRHPQWNNCTLIRGNVAVQVAALKQGEGGPILVAGSRTLVDALMQHDLVDEYLLMIFPVVLGSGLRLFPESMDKISLRLLDSRTFGSGVVVHSYCPASARKQAGSFVALQENSHEQQAGWFEIYVQDMPRAKAFYEAVFDTQLSKLDGTRVEIWAFPGNMERYGAPGSLLKMPGVPSGANSMLVYFSCADCAIQAARAAKAGGRIEKERFSIGQYGFIALVIDAEGNMIGLHSLR